MPLILGQAMLDNGLMMHATEIANELVVLAAQVVMSSYSAQKNSTSPAHLKLELFITKYQPATGNFSTLP